LRIFIFARYKEGKYQLLVEGDDMSQGSVEGSWIECGSSDIRVDPELPIGRTDEAVLVLYYIYIVFVYIIYIRQFGAAIYRRQKSRDMFV